MPSQDMPSRLKNIFNAARLSCGLAPLIVQTSLSVGKVNYEGAFAKNIGLNRGMAPLIPVRLVAEASSVFSPKKNPWKVSMQVGGFGVKPVKESLSYGEMLSFLREQEIGAARQDGMTGSDADVAAQRKNAVARDNVLKFAT